MASHPPSISISEGRDHSVSKSEADGVVMVPSMREASCEAREQTHAAKLTHIIMSGARVRKVTNGRHIVGMSSVAANWQSGAWSTWVQSRGTVAAERLNWKDFGHVTPYVLMSNRHQIPAVVQSRGTVAPEQLNWRDFGHVTPQVSMSNRRQMPAVEGVDIGAHGANHGTEGVEHRNNWILAIPRWGGRGR
jgi:hypothetical protein